MAEVLDRSILASEESARVQARLGRLRTSARWLLLAYGVCAVLSGGCLALLTVIALDWSLDLPPALRIVGAGLFVVGFGLATLHWIVKPLQRPLTLAQVAGRVEMHFGGLSDRLSSTVSFLTRRPEGSADLVRQVVTNTDRMMAGFALEKALTSRPAVGQARLLAAGLLTLGLVAWSSPQWAVIGIQRYAQPFGDAQWPRNIEIEPLSGNLKVARGEAVTLRMRVVRGGRDDLRGLVYVVDGSGEKLVRAMNPDGDGEFACVLDSVSSDLTYWFEAGDDDTRRTPARLTVIRRPTLVDAQATVRPPRYAAEAPTITADLGAGALLAVAGSVADVVARVSKPVRLSGANGEESSPDAAPDAWLEFSGGRRLPMSLVNGDPLQVAATFEVLETESLRIAVVDRDGFSNLSGSAYEIVTRPDHPPRIHLREPHGVVEITPRGSVHLAIQAGDDFGLSDARLVADVPGSDTGVDRSLFDAADLVSDAHGVSWATRYEWRAETLGVTPPAQVTYRIEAYDNRIGESGRGQSASTATLRLKIVSEGDYESRVREEFSHLQKQLRTLRADQQALQEATEAAVARVRADEAGAGSGQAPAADLAERQNALVRRQSELSKQFDRLSGRMEANRVHDAESQGRIRQAGAEGERAAAGPMTEALATLQALRDGAVTAEEASAQWTEAVTHEEQAVSALGAILSGLEQWGDLDWVVARLREVHDGQDQLREETAGWAGQTLGRNPDEWTDSQHGAVERVRRRQEQLAEEFTTLRERLVSLSSGGAVPDPASLAAVDAALRAAAAGEIPERMSGAQSAMRAGRLAGAEVEQRAAVRGLDKMLAAIQERHSRQLMELAKRLLRAEQLVGHLLEEQQSIHLATTEAVTLRAEAVAFEELADEQARVRRNAEQVAKELLDQRDTQESGDLVREASRSMAGAHQALAEARGAAADGAQQDAVRRLGEALALLETRARTAAHAAAQRLLTAAGRQLADLREQQSKIATDTSALRQAVADRGRMDRAATRQAAELAGAQRTTHQSADQVRVQLEGTVVYHRVLEQVCAEMQRSQQALEARRIDPALEALHREILRRLDQLVQALHQAERLPPSDAFAGDLGGAGGGGGGAGESPIPTAAELLMVKLLQADLLEETKSLQNELDPEAMPTERQLRSAEALGGRQRELREVTELLVRKAGGL